MAWWESREASPSWGLGSRAAGVFLELSFPSASSEQVKNPTEGPSLESSPSFSPSQRCLIPHAGRGGGQACSVGVADKGSEVVGKHHSRSFPSSAAPRPLPPSKSLWEGESIPGGGNGKCKGCGFRMWRRGKPASLAGTEVRGPPGIAQWRRTCLTRGREGEREMQWTQPAPRMPEAGQWLGDHSTSECSPLYPLALRQGLRGGVRVILPGPSAPESLCSGSSIPGTGSWHLCLLSLCIPSSPTRSVQFPPFYR